MTIYFTSLPGDYAMDLSAALLNFRRSDREFKTSHVTFSQSSLRSYVSFDVRWSGLTESSGFIHTGTGGLHIEFSLHHPRAPLEPQPFPPGRPSAPPETPRAISIQTVADEDCLAAVLVILFHIPFFRAAVYRLNVIASPQLALLQRVFADLQMRPDYVDIGEFVRAIRWPFGRPVTSRPRIALDIVVEPVGAALRLVSRTFFEKFCIVTGRSIIESPGVGIVQERHFASIGIEFPVEGPESLESIFRGFSSMKRPLEPGACDAYSRQEVIRIPDVLFILLNRFTADSRTGTLNKNCHDLMVPTEFNFNILKAPTEKIDDGQWDLHSVLVHVGQADRHVLWANVRGGSRWREFRSAQVIEIPVQRAVNGSDCLMLVYTRSSRASDIFAEVMDYEIPAHIRRAPAELPGEFTINAVTEADFAENVLRGEMTCGHRARHTVTVNPNDTFRSFLGSLGPLMKADPAKLRVWSVSEKGVIRDIIPLDERCGVLPAEVPVVFVERTTSPAGICLSENQIVVFLKFYERRRPIHFIGSAVTSLDLPISSLFPSVSSIMKAGDATPYWAYHESRDFFARRLRPYESFRGEGIECGATLIFQCPPGYHFFESKFEFGAALPRIGPSPKFPRFEFPDVPEDLIVIDVTLDDDIGRAFRRKIETVDEFLDFNYHHAMLAVLLVGADEPPHFYFRVPISISLDHLEELVSTTMGLKPNLTFYPPNAWGDAPADEPIDRAAADSLRKELLAIARVDEAPVLIFVEQESDE